jgi:WD40-like Beta Propeller Repeat
MKYDAATQKFTDYEVLATPPAGRHYAWPAFTPDGKWVVYQDGVGDDLATWSTNTGKIA